MEAVVPNSVPHSWIDDFHAIITGALFVALGLTMFAHDRLLTGGIAGVAFLVSYATGANLALMFFLLNIPFFGLAWFRLGAEFTLKSFVAVAMVSAGTALAPQVVRFELLNPWAASIIGGLLIGIGVLALLRHRASVGGVNILAQWLQQTRGFSAGKVQMSVDVGIILAALFVVSPEQVIQSIIGAVMIGAVLALNHRPGRYLGV